MRLAVFSSHPHDERFLSAANEGRHELVFIDARLSARTAGLADGFEAICAFVNDDLSRPVLEQLAGLGVRFIALRSAGFNHVDIDAARNLGLRVARVPAYSPHSIAEHTVAMMLALNRQIHRAYNRVREGNFALDGLLGFDLHGRTVGVVGTGKIGERVAAILAGFGCLVLAFDLEENRVCVDMGVTYVSLDELYRRSDIITLHAPLTPATEHLIDSAAIDQMKGGVMIINTSRGALVDTVAAIEGLKAGKIGYLGLDVYEEEEELFFEDRSDRIIADDVFSRLLTFPNVIVTGHQAFFTVEALGGIAETTIANLDAYAEGSELTNAVV